MEAEVVAAIVTAAAALGVGVGTTLGSNRNVKRTLKAHRDAAHEDRMWMAKSRAYVAAMDWSYGGPVDVDTEDPLLMAPQAIGKLQREAFSVAADLLAYGSREMAGIFDEYMRVRLLIGAFANSQRFAGSPEYHWLRKHVQPFVDAHNQLQRALVTQARHELQGERLEGPVKRPDMEATLAQLGPETVAFHYRRAWSFLGEVQTAAAAVATMSGLRTAWDLHGQSSPKASANRQQEA